MPCRTASGKYLVELCTSLFNCAAPMPLEVAIHNVLIELLAGEFDGREVRRFLARWVRRNAYLAAVARADCRRDLNGHPTEPPTPDQIDAGSTLRQRGVA